MNAAILETEEGRVMVSKVRAEGDRSVCLEIHRKQIDGLYKVFFMLLTPEEAREVGAALLEVQIAAQLARPSP